MLSEKLVQAGNQFAGVARSGQVGLDRLSDKLKGLGNAATALGFDNQLATAVERLNDEVKSVVGQIAPATSKAGIELDLLVNSTTAGSGVVSMIENSRAFDQLSQTGSVVSSAAQSSSDIRPSTDEWRQVLSRLQSDIEQIRSQLLASSSHPRNV